jgi:hypothetical protein
MPDWPVSTNSSHNYNWPAVETHAKTPRRVYIDKHSRDEEITSAMDIKTRRNHVSQFIHSFVPVPA